MLCFAFDCNSFFAVPPATEAEKVYVVGGYPYDDTVLVGDIRSGQWQRLSEPEPPSKLALRRYVMPIEMVEEKGKTR